MIEIEIRPSEAAKVPRYVKELKTALLRSKEIGLEQALAEWGERVSERRLIWLEQHKDKLNLEGAEVRKAFQLVLFEYMGLRPEEVQVVEETERKITWKCYSFCPYFEAVQELGMDTRIVCKWATEFPVQVLLNALNPHLRYSRNYENGIRPYVEYCEETIELIE